MAIKVVYVCVCIGDVLVVFFPATIQVPNCARLVCCCKTATYIMESR